MHVQQNVNIHNRFDVHVDNIETGEHSEFVGYNIVLNSMYNRLCAGSTYFVNIHFGSGAGTPDPTRTSLFTHVGTRAATTDEILKASPTSKWKRKIVLNPEEFVGSTISEVGIAFDGTATNLLTHSMLKDAEGNPVSITKKDNDVITIFATVFVTMGNTDILTGMPSSNALLNYLMGDGWPTASFGLVETKYGPRLGSTANVTWTADIPNRKRKTNLVRLGIDVANGQALGLDFSSVFQVPFPAVGLFEGQQYTDVPIGTGDGIKTEFFLPSDTIYTNTLEMKVSGNITPFELTKLPAYRTIVMSDVVSIGQSEISGDGKTVVCIGTTGQYAYNFMMSIYKKTDYGIIKLPNPPLSGSLDHYKSTNPILSFDGTTLALVKAYDGGTLFIFDLINNVWVPRLTVPTTQTSMAKFSSDGQKILLGGMSVQQYTNNIYTANISFNPEQPKIRFYCVEATPNFEYVCGVADNGKTYVYRYDSESNTFVQVGTVPLFTGAAMCDISDDGQVLVVSYIGMPKESIRVFDLVDNNWILRLPEILSPVDNTFSHQDFATSVKVNPNGTILNISWHIGTNSGTSRTLYWNNNEWIDISTNTASVRTFCKYNFAISNDAMQVLKSPYVCDASQSFRSLIKFPTPPVEGAPITANYKTKGLHKTTNYVVDCSCSIQFGEGV